MNIVGFIALTSFQRPRFNQVSKSFYTTRQYFLLNRFIYQSSLLVTKNLPLSSDRLCCPPLPRAQNPNPRRNEFRESHSLITHRNPQTFRPVICLIHQTNYLLDQQLLFFL